MTPEEQDQFFAERGVDPEIRRARPYFRWTTSDREPVRAAYRGLPSPGQRGYMTRIAGQADGFVIVRHPPPGLRLDHLYAEIRPDHAVATAPETWHIHPEEPPTETPINPKTGRPLPARAVRTAKEMRTNGHIDRDKAEDDHKGSNVEYVHCHADLAKYVFPPSPKREHRFFHHHDTAYKTAAARAKHVRAHHDGIDRGDRHRHARMIPDERVNYAKRIDVHPLAVPLFEKAERVFFVIEGCIKADAVLSAGEAVFSVPSVTLWDCDELPAFARRYLRGKTVFIVPDADWIKNGAVITQARLCQSRLKRLGIRAHVASPPADRLSEGIKAVDDLLGKGGGRIDDLLVLDRHPGPVAEWVGMQVGRKDARRRNAEVLEAMSMHADAEGRYSGPLRAVARIMDTPHKRVCRALEDLVRYEAVTVNGSLSVMRGYFSRAFDWKRRPEIIIHPHLRAVDLPPRPLREVTH